MRPLALCLLIVLAPLQAGCIVKTAADVVTFPVRAGADALTTTDSERDEDRGKQIRKREEQLRRDYKDFDKLCKEGDRQACATRDQIGAEYNALQRY